MIRETDRLATAILVAQELKGSGGVRGIFLCTGVLAPVITLEDLRPLTLVATVNTDAFRKWNRLLREQTECTVDCRLPHENSENCRLVRLMVALEMLGIFPDAYNYKLLMMLNGIVPLDVHLMPDLWQMHQTDILAAQSFSDPKQLARMAETSRRVDLRMTWWQ
jgi:hypothetical protein